MRVVYICIIINNRQNATSQLRNVQSGLHFVTYLDVGNFWDKSTETTLHDICVEVVLWFVDINKPSQSVSLIYELALLAGIRKFEKNLLKTSCKAAPPNKNLLLYTIVYYSIL